MDIDYFDNQDISPYIVLEMYDYDINILLDDTYLGGAHVNISNLKKFYEENDSDQTTAKDFVRYG